MRIPGINQTGVPGAEQISLGAISSAAQGKMRVTEALTKVVSDYEVISNKAEAAAQYGQNYESSLMDMDAAYDDMINQPHYDEDKNPTYRGLEDKWNKMSMGLVTSRLKNFTNKIAKSEYQKDISSYLRGKSNDMRGVVRSRQVDYSKGVLNLQIAAYKQQPGGDNKISQAIMDQVQMGTLDFVEGQALNQKSLEEHSSTQLNMSIQATDSDSDLDAIRLSLFNNDDPYLTQSSIQSAFTSITQRETQIDKDFDNQQESVYVDTLKRIVVGDLDNQSEIDQLLITEEITPKYHETLSKRLIEEEKGPALDDWSEFSLIKTNIGSYTAIDILNNEMLTRESRIKLIADLDKFNDAEDKDLDWVSSQEGREAFRRLKAAFPVLKSSSLAGMMGQASAENSAALTKLYDRISKLSPGLKISSAIDMANQIIEESKTGKPLTPAITVPNTIQEIIDTTRGGSTERRTMLDAWGKKNQIQPSSNDYLRVSQINIMSLAKELGVIV